MEKLLPLISVLLNEKIELNLVRYFFHLIILLFFLKYIKNYDLYNLLFFLSKSYIPMIHHKFIFQ